MGAVWLCTRAQLRGWALAGLVLALLVGLAGGIALAALAGAHRSDTALALPNRQQHRQRHALLGSIGRVDQPNRPG